MRSVKTFIDPSLENLLVMASQELEAKAKSDWILIKMKQTYTF